MAITKTYHIEDPSNYGRVDVSYATVPGTALNGIQVLVDDRPLTFSFVEAEGLIECMQTIMADRKALEDKDSAAALSHIRNRTSAFPADK